MVAQAPDETNTTGAFVRQEYSIRNRITADGSSGFRADRAGGGLERAA